MSEARVSTPIAREFSLATLILGAVGAAVGGPVGGAVGGFLGQSIDQALYPSAPRVGPRLGDLAVQTSAYGSRIPRIYGRMRVAGTVVWATDLQESVSEDAGSKGQADTVGFTYSVSLAIAVSSRTIQSVGRIWADGKLIRGVTGDLKVKTKFRVYRGTDDQSADPVIIASEGFAKGTAFRGIAVVIFEQLQLAEFGNRIPLLTFEVFADVESPTLAAIIGDISRGIVVVDDARRIQGYAAHGVTIEESIQPLIVAFGIRLDTSERDLPPIAPLPEHFGCGLNAAEPQVAHEQEAAVDLPSYASASYYDLDRDYQSGEQHASVRNSVGRHAKLDLPAVLYATDAKATVENFLIDTWRRATKYIVRLPVDYIGLAPGDRIVLPDGRIVEAETVSVLDYCVVVSCHLPRERRVSVPNADAGRAIEQADRLVQPTIIRLLDLPAMNQINDLPLIHIAASNGSGPWQSRSLKFECAGQKWFEQTSPQPVKAGTARSRLGPASSALVDRKNILVVRLDNRDDWLLNVSSDSLALGTNLAAVGTEMLQFLRVDQVSEGEFALSHLLRGRFGTEWAIDGHVDNEAFVLIEPQTVRQSSVPASMLNALILAEGTSVGDFPIAGSSSINLKGESLRPPSPVHLSASRSSAGALKIQWVRRSRIGFDWIDEFDSPLGEDSEKYTVSVVGITTSHIFECSVPFLLIEAGEFELGPIRIGVRQIGRAGRSHEASIAI